jgi:hypothetical protein
MAKGDQGEPKQYLWMAVAAGAALGTAALVWLVWYGDPARRMERLLRRCQERITDIEESLGQLEASQR